MNILELKSRFSSITKIKKGGQKTVYKAIASDGETVALKIIGNAADPRVLQEIDIVKGLALSNVPKIIDSGIVTDDAENEDALYIVEQFMLNTAENQIKEFKKRGMSGQNRDFAPAIEANRVAMCANDEDYGLKLRFDWQQK